MDISRVCTLLRQLGLETSIEESAPGIPPSFKALSDDGIIGLRGTDEGLIRLSYLNTDRESARRVLKDCPEIIKHWYNQLDNLIEEGDFQQIPFFFDIFTPNQAMEICFHLGSRMMDQISQTRYSL